MGTLGGSKVEVNLSILMRKRATAKGTVLRSRTLAEKAALTREFVRRVLPLFESGKVRAVVHRVYPLEQVSDAHREMEADRNFGKIVLTVSA